ncbi:hypothetical protein D3C86_1820930 [compost metagenome]
MIEWVPTAKLASVHDAVPELNVPVPSTVEPSLNVTVPVGPKMLAMPFVTVALNVTEFPYVVLSGLALTATTVGIPRTDCVKLLDVLP